MSSSDYAPWKQFASRIVRHCGQSTGRDVVVALGLGALYAGLLLGTTDGLGYARDEGFYFHAARSYGSWFELLWSDPAKALELETVDRHFAVNHEHPALIKSFMALSFALFHEHLGWIEAPGDAYRLPGIVLGALAVALTYHWAARVVGRLPALVGAVSLAMMPRVFFHAHLACFDVPVATMWLLTTLGYWWALERGGWGRAVVVGLLYGLLLNTKHNAWLLPPALVLHWALLRGGSFWRGLMQRRIEVPWPLVAMALIGPAILLSTWPWLWHNTVQRLEEWYIFHRHHVYYNMEFLGHTYWKPPMPRSYAWVMTAATVPTITLLLAGIGGLTAMRPWVERHLAPWALQKVPRSARLERSLGMPALAGNASKPSREESGWRPNAELDPHGSCSWPTPRAVYSAYVLWAVCILTSYAPWLSSDTPIFGGTKHWITAYPFIALFAALGFRALNDGVRRTLSSSARIPTWRGRVVSLALGACALAAPVAMTLNAHPWGLSAYTPLVGGAPGAATLGLNRTFWGYTTGSMVPYLNEHIAAHCAVYVHDTAISSYRMLQEDGSLRADLRGTLSISGSQAALYHHEPHMGRVEHQIWVDYGTTVPAHICTHDGVPVVWLYERPTRRARRVVAQ